MLKLFQSRVGITFKTNYASLKYFSSSGTDYYAVLGLQRGASLEEIKEAYRNLAKMYHPDVNTSGVYHEANGEKFRAIAEAYGVLSVPENKVNYDFLNQNTPESIYREKRSENYKKMTERGFDGQLFRERQKKGTYADEKLKILQEERKKFNVDAFGRYKGGVPNKSGTKRGGALGLTGTLHDPSVHNMIINPHPDSQFVTDEDAMAFKLYQNEDKYVIQKRWLWFKAEVDYDYFKYNTYRIAGRWIRNFFLFFFVCSVGAGIYLRATNRKLKNKLAEYIKKNGLIENIQINGEKLILTANGVIKKI